MFTTKILQQYIKDGLIRVNKHPSHDLYIYNYTETTQFQRLWDEVTLACRGLILNGQGEVVARPFPKFFNLGETENQIIPNEPFEVFEKMDGSLGILYWIEDIPYIATRGSFTSRQAIYATEMLRTWGDQLFRLNREKTYLFEIIYPDNRIVVDYGNMHDLVLIGIIDNASGQDEPLENVGFSIVESYHGINDISTLASLAETNREGFVVKYPNGLRYKIKFEEYLRIHRIVNRVSSRSIWEYLSTGEDISPFLALVPDEFYTWIKQTQQKLIAEFEAIENQCKADFRTFKDRKAAAMYFQTCTYPGILFSMLDNKPYADKIWRMIKPDFERPFGGE